MTVSQLVTKDKELKARPLIDVVPSFLTIKAVSDFKTGLAHEILLHTAKPVMDFLETMFRQRTKAAVISWDELVRVNLDVYYRFVKLN